VEPNPKVKQETEAKFQILREKLVGNEVSQSVVAYLKTLTQAAERSEFQTVVQVHKDMA